jgi:subtilase family serine protease
MLQMRRCVSSLAVLAFAGVAAVSPSIAGRAAANVANPTGAVALDSVMPGTTETAKPVGFAPTQIRNQYGFNAMGSDAHGNPIDGRGQIIAIVFWNDDPFAATDLAKFLSTYGYLEKMNGLPGTPACTVSRTIHTVPCFQVVYATGTKPPKESAADEVEAGLDVQWAHVTAEGADIVLVEESQNSAAAALVAIDKAVKIGASVVSMSWANKSMTSAINTHFSSASGTGFVSGSGDVSCPEANTYPAESSYVLAVGGTQLTISGGSSSETAWSSSGGGVNTTESRPGYQLNWNSSSGRAYDDVAYNAVKYPVYVGLPHPGWVEVQGVSAGIPQWAGLVADADQDRAASGKSVLADEGLLSGIYLAAGSHESKPGVIDPAMFDDIKTGSGGPSASCAAAKGYDWTTGLGTPHANALVNELTDL